MKCFVPDGGYTLLSRYYTDLQGMPSFRNIGGTVDLLRHLTENLELEHSLKTDAYPSHILSISPTVPKITR